MNYLVVEETIRANLNLTATEYRKLNMSAREMLDHMAAECPLDTWVYVFWHVPKPHTRRKIANMSAPPPREAMVDYVWPSWEEYHKIERAKRKARWEKRMTIKNRKAEKYVPEPPRVKRKYKKRKTDD